MSNVSVAQHKLHTPQISAGFQQMTSEGVAQHVRRDARGIDVRCQCRLLQELREALARQVAGAAS